MTQQIFTHFVLKVNATGEEFTEAFHQPLNSQDAYFTIGIWNRSQANHKQEFTYRLHYDTENQVQN